MSKNPKRIRDPWFALPVAVCILMDAGVSLACQPAGYWNDPAAFHEGNPAWGVLLAWGPAAFLAGFVVYCILIVGVLTWLSAVPQKLLGMFVLLAHSYGAASWCHVTLPENLYWWALMALFLAEAAAFAVYWHLSSARAK